MELIHRVKIAQGSHALIGKQLAAIAQVLTEAPESGKLFVQDARNRTIMTIAEQNEAMEEYANERSEELARAGKKGA